jgi:hypothetical protein
LTFDSSNSIDTCPFWFVQMNSYMAASICDEVLKACSRLADPDLALQLVHAMRCLGVPRGFKAHGHVVGALCAACKHEVGFSLAVAQSSYIFASFVLLSTRIHPLCPVFTSLCISAGGFRLLGLRCSR